MGMIIQNGILLSSSKVEIQPVIYSEEEREIGVFRDGKPLYEKTIFIANLGYTTTKSEKTITTINNLDNLVNVEAMILGSDGVDFFTLPYVHSTSTAYIDCHKSSGIVFFYATSTWAAARLITRVRYTKTTDTAGSGIWATTGLPAHHYSTSEQVVGTWIDGKPLYEKTIPTNTAFGNSWTKLTEIDDVDCIVETTVIVNEGGNRSYGVRQGYFCEVSTVTGEEGFVMLYNSTGFNVTVKYVTIRYTKTSS